MRTEALQPCVSPIASGNNCGDSSSHVVPQLCDNFPAAFNCPRKYPYVSLSTGNHRVIHIDVPGKGWAHATAHGADLLRVLARNGILSVSQQSRIVPSSISARPPPQPRSRGARMRDFLRRWKVWPIARMSISLRSTSGSRHCPRHTDSCGKAHSTLRHMCGYVPR